jgi:hypothetical protein
MRSSIKGKLMLFSKRSKTVSYKYVKFSRQTERKRDEEWDDTVKESGMKAEHERPSLEVDGSKKRKKFGDENKP